MSIHVLHRGNSLSLKQSRTRRFDLKVHKWSHIETHTLVPWQSDAAHVRRFGAEGRCSLKGQLSHTTNGSWLDLHILIQNILILLLYKTLDFCSSLLHKVSVSHQLFIRSQRWMCSITHTCPDWESLRVQACALNASLSLVHSMVQPKANIVFIVSLIDQRYASLSWKTYSPH